MLKPVNHQVLLEKIESKSMIILLEENTNFYHCISQASDVSYNYIDKNVYVLDDLKEVEYEGKKYYLVSEDKILCVEE